MTVFVLIVSALISAWARQVERRLAKTDRLMGEVIATTIFYTFGAIAIGAGIQLLFRG